MEKILEPTESIVKFQMREESIFCKKNETLNAIWAPFIHNDNLLKINTSFHSLRTGVFIGENLDKPLLQIDHICWDIIDNKCLIHITLKATKDITIYPQKTYIIWNTGYSLARITLSDKGFLGYRKDESGPLIEDIISAHLNISKVINTIIPDNYYLFKSLLSNLIHEQKVDLIVTTGGTGVTDRDITPDVVEEVIERRLWGFEHAMYLEGQKKTHHAIISRAICGISEKTLIINLPGSKKAVKENLKAILPALNHTLQKIKNDPSECGV